MIYGEIPKRERVKRAKELAVSVGLGHRMNHRPTELSGGECQRTAIARALANEPAYLLADEPTGNLDEKTGEEIMRLFHDLHEQQQVTIVMVTHNPELEPQFNRVIRLRDGRVVSDND
jgi:putative ABC transport system ATP-binding protein